MIFWGSPSSGAVLPGYLPGTTDLIFKLFKMVCVCIRAGVHACVHNTVLRSEGRLGSSFHHVDLGDQTLVVRFGRKCLYPLDQLTGPPVLL